MAVKGSFSYVYPTVVTYMYRTFCAFLAPGKEININTSIYRETGHYTKLTANYGPAKFSQLI